MTYSTKFPLLGVNCYKYRTLFHRDGMFILVLQCFLSLRNLENYILLGLWKSPICRYLALSWNCSYLLQNSFALLTVFYVISAFSVTYKEQI